MLRTTVGLLLVLLPAAAGAQGPVVPRKIQVAEGMFLYVTPPYSDVGLDGNAVAILSDDGVLVFDANGTPAAAVAVLADIGRMTSRPVRYLVLSHWHWDHWYGAEVYRRAFPGIQIIATEATRQLMTGPALAFNQPGLDVQLPEHLRAVQQQLDSARAGKREADATRWERHLRDDSFFLDQKRNVHHTFPNLTFTDSLTIHLGSRRIQVLHYDRAITPGDAFLYLPDERIVISGDLLVNPITFALDCYPSGWLHTLERIDSLDPAIIVPGHGEPWHDKTMLETNIALLSELIRVGREAKAKGLDVEQARKQALEEVGAQRVALTHDDPALNQSFDIYLVDWFLHRVYQELDAPLGDDIAPIPQHGSG
jgi:glyoxylase-like metal-dependent hydrolase (beta-lactamase superfamily II)